MKTLAMDQDALNVPGTVTAIPLALTAVASLVLAASALAQEQPVMNDFSQRFYITGGLGVTQVEPESPSPALTVSDSNDTGGHLGIGVDLNRFLSIEGYFADLGAAQIQFLGDDAGSVDYQVYGISALGYLYNWQSGPGLMDSDINGLFRREGLSLYGRFGLGHIQNDSTGVAYFRDHPNHATFGVGLEYGFTNGVALRTEVVSYDTDAQYLNVGILKRFGRVQEPVVEPRPTPKEPVPPVPKEPEAPVLPPYIYFDYDASDLNEAARTKLDDFSENMKNNDQSIHISGHTDWIASEQYNMALSIRRAEAIASHLVSGGIDPSRITTKGYGETRPISSNDTEAGRALNRRGEIQIR